MEPFESTGWKKKIKKVFLRRQKMTNVPQGNRIALENDMKAVKIHECLKRWVRLKECHFEKRNGMSRSVYSAVPNVELS